MHQKVNFGILIVTFVEQWLHYRFATWCCLASTVAVVTSWLNTFQPQKRGFHRTAKSAAVYQSVIASKNMNQQYWASKTYIYVFATLTVGLLFLIVYLVLQLSTHELPTAVIVVFVLMLLSMLNILHGLLRYPHIILSEDTLKGRPGIIFKNKQIDLTLPFTLNENRGNIIVFQERQAVSIIFRVLPKEDHINLREHLFNHASKL
jgi:hypothetical protein